MMQGQIYNIWEFVGFPCVNCVYLLLITKVKVPLGTLSQLALLNLVSQRLFLHSFIMSHSFSSLLLLLYFPLWDHIYKSYFPLLKSSLSSLSCQNLCFCWRKRALYENNHFPIAVNQDFDKSISASKIVFPIS